MQKVNFSNPKVSYLNSLFSRYVCVTYCYLFMYINIIFPWNISWSISAIILMHIQGHKHYLLINPSHSRTTYCCHPKLLVLVTLSLSIHVNISYLIHVRLALFIHAILVLFIPVITYPCHSWYNMHHFSKRTGSQCSEQALTMVFLSSFIYEKNDYIYFEWSHRCVHVSCCIYRCPKMFSVGRNQRCFYLGVKEGLFIQKLLWTALNCRPVTEISELSQKWNDYP